MNRFFTSDDCAKLCDDIETISKSSSMSFIQGLAKRIQLMQKETNRINCSNSAIDSTHDLCHFLYTEPSHMLVYVENIGRDFFDYERSTL